MIFVSQLLFCSLIIYAASSVIPPSLDFVKTHSKRDFMCRQWATKKSNILKDIEAMNEKLNQLSLLCEGAKVSGQLDKAIMLEKNAELIKFKQETLIANLKSNYLLLQNDGRNYLAPLNRKSGSQICKIEGPIYIPEKIILYQESFAGFEIFKKNSVISWKYFHPKVRPFI